MQNLSDRVGLSPSPVARRLNRLEKDGYIKGYAALIDEARLGFGISVFVSVKLDRQIDDALANFEKAVRLMPEVVDCWLMTGNRDYLLRIATRDMGDFERFLTSKLTKLSFVAGLESRGSPARRSEKTKSTNPPS